MFGIRIGGVAAAVALLSAPVGAGPQAWGSTASASTLPALPVEAIHSIPLTGDVSPQIPVQSDTLPVFILREAPGAEIATPIVPTVPATPVVKNVRGSLSEMVATHRSASVPNRERECLAGAIYFESKGEPLSGQIAVGQVIANRAKSGRFPKSWCGVVFQRSQFSFVRGGNLPPIPRSSAHWKTAVAVAHIVANDMHDAVVPKALFFHARYVSPNWKRVSKVATVGNHIFYR